MTTVPNPGASGQAIGHHYDVESRFWRLWLGETMTYSCAHWQEGDDLDAAQLRKLDGHVERACAANAGRVLDVGCGWGALLQRLVRHHGAKEVVGLTLSRAQAAYIQELQLPGVEVRVESWSAHEPKAPYDAVVSIGAFEHFAQPGRSRSEKVAGYRSFFSNCHRWLARGGRMSLQTIAYGNMLPSDQSEFLKKEIYPESELPYLDEIVAACSGYFELYSMRNDRAHYVQTLRVWLRALRASRPAAVALVGAETVRRYEDYLRASILGFSLGNTGLLRMELRRNDVPRSHVAVEATCA